MYYRNILKEIDLVEERDGRVVAWEFKWSQSRKPKIPATFANKYNVVDYKIISPGNLYLLK